MFIHKRSHEALCLAFRGRPGNTCNGPACDQHRPSGGRSAALKVDLDVASRPRAADQRVAFGGWLKRFGLIVDRTTDQSAFAGMTNSRSAGPPHRHVAPLSEFQQRVALRTPRDCQSTSSKGNLRSRTARRHGWVRRRRLSTVDPRVYGCAGAEDFGEHSAGGDTPGHKGRCQARQKLRGPTEIKIRRERHPQALEHGEAEPSQGVEVLPKAIRSTWPAIANVSTSERQ